MEPVVIVPDAVTGTQPVVSATNEQSAEVAKDVMPKDPPVVEPEASDKPTLAITADTKTKKPKTHAVRTFVTTFLLVYLVSTGAGIAYVLYAA